MVRHLVGARVVGISIDRSNQIRSLLKTFGLRVGGGAGRVLAAKVRGLVEGKPVASVVAASFSAAVEAPGHFRRPRSVGACLGLTPRRHQSGEIDRSAGVSKRGDKLLRSCLFEAAACLLVRVQRPSALKAWGLRLVQRLGFKRAAVALARKIGVVPHAMWKAGAPFQAWPSGGASAAV